MTVEAPEYTPPAEQPACVWSVSDAPEGAAVCGKPVGDLCHRATPFVDEPYADKPYSHAYVAPTP